MAFRASNIVPQRAYDRVKQAAVNLKGALEGANTTMAAGAVSLEYLAEVRQRLVDADTQFDSLKVTPGLAAYAQSQEDDNAYDVAAEFTAMQAAITNALAWITTNEPDTVSINNLAVTTTFSSGATSGFRTQLQSVIDSIA